MNPNDLVWMIPTGAALLLWGLAQGFIKKNIDDVSPARFCLYYFVAISIVNLGYYLAHGQPPLLAQEGRAFALFGILAYFLDGAAWVLYYLSIIHGPITIVGTLSAAYPAVTILLARIFLAETLSETQYLAAAMVIIGCIGLAYDPTGGDGKKRVHLRWIPLAMGALLLWGASQTVAKYAYSLPGSNEAKMSIYAMAGGFLTLFLYGWAGTRKEKFAQHDWTRAALPMILMAGGSLMVIVATQSGPISIVTAVSGAYPVVTLVFARSVLKEKISRHQWIFLAMSIVGIVLCSGSGA